MCKKKFLFLYLTALFLSIGFIGFTIGLAVTAPTPEPYKIEGLTEMEQAKLENGEPVQIMSWYRTGEEWHAVYARKIPFKRYIQDNQILVYDVVLSGDEYYQQERFE